MSGHIVILSGRLSAQSNICLNNSNQTFKEWKEPLAGLGIEKMIRAFSLPKNKDDPKQNMKTTLAAKNCTEKKKPVSLNLENG